MAAPHVSASRQRRSSALCSYIVLAMVLLQLAGVSGMKKRRGLQEGGEAVYCVAKPEAEAGKLQEALDWACGEGASMGSVDCQPIQKGGSCYEPDTVANHASYAFTLYYSLQNAASHACDFNGLATLTYTNPSSGACVYPTSTQSSSSSSGSNASTTTTSSPPVGDTLQTPFPFSSSPAPSPSGAPTTHRSLFFGTGSYLLCILLPVVILLL